ncbi:uracil-DNA glycosylase [Mycoplasmopsis lipofaciens]|uniref:uracil-DNA glycosylase n=1 Tax=Mycoplasmopsis lipofaciens TaxID=114884 RepID=UPI00048A42F0|nr:uracil-DNA glycosylase [Mycoplasmopsis lipofaciens]
MKNSFISFFNNESKKDYFINIQQYLKKLDEQNIIYYPKKENIFTFLDYCEVEEIKLIILGQDPYFLPNQADGMAFSTNDTKPPRSLINIIKELKKDYPDSKIETFSLKSWAKQGVLLLNTALTVEHKKPNSHKNLGWNIFIENCIRFILEKNTNVIFGIWGNQAFNFLKPIINDMNVDERLIIRTSHPSPLSYSKTENSFKDSKFFIRVNALLKTNNQINFDIKKEQ